MSATPDAAATGRRVVRHGSPGAACRPRFVLPLVLLLAVEAVTATAVALAAFPH